MAVDIAFVGRSGRTVEYSWTSRDALLYAIAVGTGQSPTEELEFTTENSGAAQRVLQSFVCVGSNAPVPEGFAFDLTKSLHAEMSFEMFAELQPEGRRRFTLTIAGIYDKGSGALVSTQTDVVDAENGEPLARLGSGIFVRGEGGFGGERGPSDEWSRPERDPDTAVVYRTRPEQALLYRLTGDRNPLHTNPESPSELGSKLRSCTACVHTGSPAGRSCTRWRAPIRLGSAACTRGSASRSPWGKTSQSRSGVPRTAAFSARSTVPARWFSTEGG